MFTAEVRYKTMLALSEMIRIHYYGGRNGWTTKDCDYYRRCLRLYLINQGEDTTAGLTYMTVNSHMLHTFPNYLVPMWGEPSNSRCWRREGKIREFIAEPNNAKNFALSMAISAVVNESLDLKTDDFLRREDLLILFKDRVSLRVF